MARKYRLQILTVVCLVAAAALFLPPDAAAQRRVYSGSGYMRRGGRSPYYYYPRFYSPFYYYDPFFWGGPCDTGPYAILAHWHYGPVQFDLTGAARLQVTPKQTQVFVDGYFVGTAETSSMAPSRGCGSRPVSMGARVLSGRLSNGQTARALPGAEGTITIKHVMEPVKPGEASERPTPTEPPQTAESPNPAPPAGYGRRPA